MLEFRPPADRKARREWWRRQVQRQHDTRVPVADFCRRLGVSTVTFYAWRRRFEDDASADTQATTARPKPRQAPDHPTPTPDFVPVSIVGAAPTTSLEVCLGNARVVRLLGPVDPKLLRAAIRAAGQLDRNDTGAP